MSRQEEGLKSDALRAALDSALAGDPRRLEELLARHGSMPSPKPNLKLAQAFGAELARQEGRVAQLLERLGGNDAAPDTAEVFLPIAAAHGWAARLREGSDVEAGYAALELLCADERGPVRVGTLDALIGISARDGGADALVERARQWLEQEDRELCFGAAALVVEVLADARVLAVVRDGEALLTYLSGVIDKVGNAPRSAERSEGRRRCLTSLAQTLPKVVRSLRAGERGHAWFEAECERAKHPDVRRVLSDCIVKLTAQAGSAGTVPLRGALERSAKPLRDPTLPRKGTGRGKQTRRTR
ncbi:MAG TPA: hypothetical protein VFZ61_03295 [Polyangiales bacterium]